MSVIDGTDVSLARMGLRGRKSNRGFGDPGDTIMTELCRISFLSGHRATAKAAWPFSAAREPGFF